MKSKILSVIFLMILTSTSWGIPKGHDEEHEGWMSYKFPNGITILMKNGQPTVNPPPKYLAHNNFNNSRSSSQTQRKENESPHQKILEQVIDLVAKNREDMCKANPNSEWELNLSVGVDGNIKIVEIKTQATIIVRVKC